MNQTNKTTPKDFFLHLGAVVTLYASIIALINLIFSIINYYLPDTLNNYFYSSDVAWPISTLIVLFPLFYVFEKMIIKSQIVDIDKKNIWIWKWRIYLTLFLTGALFVGDLITLIFTYLNGEISARFIYKVIAILIIASSVFKYYFFSINESSRWSKLVKNVTPWFGIIIVLVTIIAGFIAVGSPIKQRAMRFDNQRVNDLQSIQSQIINYWQMKGKLPVTLEDMNDSLSNSIIPKDPETKIKYEYSITNNLQFKLCANFSLRSQDNLNVMMYSPSYVGDSWKHEIGNICFNRTIDQQKYPVNIKQ